MKQKLLKISFIISISGILLLLFLINMIKPREITTQDEIKINDYVKISGKITGENNYNDFSVLALQNDKGKITITCNCQNFLNKTVIVEGKITEYKNKLQIQAEKIKEI